MKRVTTAVLAGATVATLAYASASILDVDAKPLQAGSTSVTCDEDGVDVRFNLETNTGTVSKITVDGIDEACWDSGAKVFAAIDGVPVMSGGASPVITGASHELTFAPRLAETVNDVKVWIG